MDREVGDILEQLKQDGLDEDTIVFFFSDHGSGMPRHKRALLDSGMHVPLLIRIPEKWKKYAPGKPGSTSERMVAFVDFAPTILSLTETDIPKHMQSLFLALKMAEKESIFSDTVTGWIVRTSPAPSAIITFFISVIICLILAITNLLHGLISEKSGMNFIGWLIRKK